MTCIVGLVDQGTVYLAGDSAATGGQRVVVRADYKVFAVGDFVMGFTSSYRMGQLLRFKFAPPLRDPQMDAFEYLVTQFVEAVRGCFKTGGYTRVDSNREEGGTFLVGYCGRLFAVESDFQVAESVHGYDAVGCGDQVALGAMHATAGLPAMDRLNRAMLAATEFTTGVRPPFQIVSTGGDS